MARSYRGIFRRANTQSRFLYGRVSNHKLRPCLTAMPNISSAVDYPAGSVAPASGAAPLAVNHTVANDSIYVIGDQPGQIGPLSSGLPPRWPPVAANPSLGCSVAIFSGGVAAYRSGVAVGHEINWTWNYGDGTSATDVGLNTTTAKTYNPAGTYNTVLNATDTLGRKTNQPLPVTAS